MTTEERELLEKNGWRVERETPLEIVHIERWSRANTIAASMVIEQLKLNSPMLIKTMYGEPIIDIQESTTDDPNNRFQFGLTIQILK